jgi:hypothetical protein
LSAYKIIKCKATTIDEVVFALQQLGCPQKFIEIHDNPEPLVRYNGAQLGRANIIVRKEWLNKHWSHGASNDLGFEKTPEGIKVHVSDYDTHWWTEKEPKFAQYAVEKKVTNELKKRGYMATKSTSGDTIELTLIKTY